MANDKNVVIELLDGTKMKYGPDVWAGIIRAFEGRYMSLSIKDDRLETLIPLAAIKRVYRSA